MNIAKGKSHPALASELHESPHPLRCRLVRFLAAVLLLGGLAPALQADNLSDALDTPQLVWSTGTNAPWFGQTTNTHDGVSAAQSGTTTNFWDRTWLETSVTGRVTVVYWWRLSSDPGWYTYMFSTNDNWASYLYYGGAEWQPGVVSFAGGSNRLRWTYTVPGSGPPNWQANAAWLDQVMVTNIAGLKPTFLVSPLAAVTTTEYAYTRTNLTALVVGDLPMTYQWQRNGTNLSEAYPFAAVTSPSLILYPRTDAISGGAYQLVASNQWGMTTSAVCTVSIVPSKPFVHPENPYDSLIASGAYYSLSVSVYGSQPFGYQWYKGGSPIPGATLYYYSFWPATLEDTGGYSVVVTNDYGAATSRVAQVIVSTDPPHIINDPNPSQSEVMPGDYTSFYVCADGPQSLTYQWHRVGSDADLSPNSGLEFSPADPTNSGFYYAVVANNNGAVTSRVSVLAVAPATVLGLALNAPGLVMTNDWAWNQWTAEVERTNTHDGLCAARSYAIGDWNSSSFSTAVAGPTNVSFWWRISAGSQAYLDISVDGSTSNTISGETLWQQQFLQLPTGEHTLTWTYRKENAGYVGQDAAWVDQFLIGDAPPQGTEITNFTASGDSPPWYLQTTTTHDGVEAWQSGAIGDNQLNSLTATVSGPGTLSFWWQVESEEGADLLEFRLNGVSQTNISGRVNWHQQFYVLGPGAHVLEWAYIKDGSWAEGADAGWVDEAMFTPAALQPTLEQALNVTNLTFTTGGDAPWRIETTNTHDGAMALQSGLIGDNQQSWLRTTVTGPGSLSFWRAVSSEECCDPLEFLLDGEVQTSIAGERLAWDYQSFSLGAGSHSLEWRYRKDGSAQGVYDAGWLDEVTFTPTVPPATLEQALNLTNLTFTTGGDAPWWIQTTNTHDGSAALQSGPIGDNQQSWLRTTVTGPGQLTYWYAISTEINHDNFYLPWLGYTSGGAYDNWQPQIINITDGTYTLEWRYQKDASGSDGSDAAWLDEVVWTPAHAGEAPVFVLHPSNTVASVDTTLGFSVQAIGELPITYTLWREGDPVSVETVASSGPVTLSTWIASTNDGGSYWAVATNAFGGATSAVAQVTVHYPATIYSSPGSRKVLKGRSFSLSVVADGEPPLTYQWYKNGTPLSGATLPTLSVAHASFSDSADYLATVSNVWLTATSSVARVTVVPCFYSARNLGTLKANPAGTSWPSEAFDINNAGEVVGWSITDETRRGYLQHGFVWVDGNMYDLGDGRTALNVASTNRLPGSSCAYSINDNFEIAGYYEYRVNSTLDGYGHAAYWRPTSCGAAVPGSWGPHCPLELVDVHPRDIYMYPPDTYAVALNSSRQILLQAARVWTPADYGYLLTPTDPSSPFTGFTTRQLGSGSGWIMPYALNNAGLVVGWYREYIGGEMPFLYDGINRIGSDALTNLYWGTLRSVNDRGLIAGHYPTTSDGYNVKRPFLLYPDGRFERLTNTTTGLWSFEVRDINNRTQLVGGNYASQGALYSDGQWFTLNDLVVNNLVTVSVANAINDRGQIVGIAWFPYEGYRACLLTPTAGGANQAPVAVDDEFRLPKPVSLRLPAARLLANDTDSDGDGLSVVALGETTTATTTATQAGGKVSLQADAIFYTPPAGTFASDQFSYTVSDGVGGKATARVTLVLDPQSSAPEPIINPPQRLPDGTFLLSGSGPAGSLVIIYISTAAQAAYWARDSVVTVPASGQWSVIRPGTVGGHAAFYKTEIQ